MYNEVIHVPLIFRIPGIDTHKIIETPVSTVDILPTVLDILKIKNPQPIDGKTLLPLIYGRQSKRGSPIFSELYSPSAISSTIIKENVKFIYTYTFDPKAPHKFELYDIRNDPMERINLVDRMKEQADILKRELFTWSSYKLSVKLKIPEARIDRKTLEQLKSLGYIH